AIIDDTLEKLGILASTLRFAIKKEIVQADSRAAEGIGFDDVRPGFEIMSVNFIDHVGFGEEKDFETTLEVLTFPILKTLAAIASLAQLVLLNHRPHGAVEHNDARAHQRFKRMEILGRHIGHN